VRGEENRERFIRLLLSRFVANLPTESAEAALKTVDEVEEAGDTLGGPLPERVELGGGVDAVGVGHETVRADGNGGRETGGEQDCREWAGKRDSGATIRSGDVHFVLLLLQECPVELRVPVLETTE
jgi:hypothetical protein